MKRLTAGISGESDYSVSLTVTFVCFVVYFVLGPRSERDYSFPLPGG